MKRLKFYLVGFVLIFSIKLSVAQDINIKYGKVSPYELNMDKCTLDTTADAAVLCRNGIMLFKYGASISLYFHKRIKVLTEEGKDYADVALSYYSKDGIEKFGKIKAQIINYENGELTKTQLSKKDFYKVEVNEYFTETRFTLPNVKVGSIIEYEYVITSDDFVNMREWLFQEEIPTIYSEIQANIEDGLDVRILYQGSRLLHKYTGEPLKKWSLMNMPPVKKEPYSPNPYDFINKIKFQLAGYYSSVNPLSGRQYNSFMTTWPKLIYELESDPEYRSIMKDRNHNELDFMSLEEKIDPKKAMHAIFSHIRDEYKWDGKRRIFPKQSFFSLVSNKIGNGAELNLLFTSYMKELGFDAYPLMISSKNNGKISKQYPIISQFNHLISYVKIHNKEYFVDLTSPNIPLGSIHWDLVNGEGLVISNTEVKWVKLQAITDSKIFTYVQLKLDEEKPSLYIERSFTGYAAYEERKNAHAESEDYYVNENFGEVYGFDLDSYETSGLEKTDENFKIKCVYTIDSLPDLLTLDAIIYKKFKSNPFLNENRKMPILFDYTIIDSYLINITLSETSEVIFLPVNEGIKLSDKAFYTYATMKSGNSITLKRDYKLKNNFINDPDEIKAVKDLYGKIINKENENIILDLSKKAHSE